MDQSENPVENKNSQPKKVCHRCGGTGLICGHVPVIDSKNC